MEPSQGTRKNNAIPGHTPPPQPSPQCFESCFTVGNLTSTHQPSKNKNLNSGSTPDFFKNLKNDGPCFTEKDQHFGHLFRVKTHDILQWRWLKKKKDQQKTWFFSGGIFLFLLKSRVFCWKSRAISRRQMGSHTSPAWSPLLWSPLGMHRRMPQGFKETNGSGAKSSALFCILRILRLSMRFFRFLVVVFDSGKLRNVWSCELRTKKHMFKAEEHFHHARISSSSGFHGLTGAGVGVAVKPVEPSSVKLYDAFHQGSPVFFIPSSC